MYGMKLLHLDLSPNFVDPAGDRDCCRQIYGWELPTELQTVWRETSVFDDVLELGHPLQYMKVTRQ